MSINRLKIALAEKGKTNKWLAQHLNKSEVTVSRWCTNEVQPSIETLLEIASALDVNVQDLITPTKKNEEHVQ